MRDYGVQKKNQEMSGLSGASRWKGIYLIIGLIVMAELVTVSGRGHIDYQSSFGPKERRKRQGVSFILLEPFTLIDLI